MNELRLSEMHVYPIKSLGGIRIPQARVMEKGLENDRRWMLVDEYGNFMSQRVQPTLTLFKLSIENGELNIVHHSKFMSHRISLDPSPSNKEEEVMIWNDTIKAVEVSEETSAWFSETLERKCRLVYFPEQNSRAVDKNFSVNNEHVSLADAYPFLMIGQASLDYLNSKLEVALPMNRFRPNFVFTGAEPHEEDNWRNFTIGNNRFVGVKPCSRCVLTTIHQDTAIQGDEPLRTLATYRKKENKILFGQNLVSVDHQTVKEGDLITIQTRS